MEDFEIDESYLSKLNDKYKQNKIGKDKKITKKQLKHIDDSISSESSDENDPDCENRFNKLISVIQNGSKKDIDQYVNSVLQTDSITKDDNDYKEEIGDSSRDNANTNQKELLDCEHFDDQIGSDYESEEEDVDTFELEEGVNQEPNEDFKFENIRHQKTIRIEASKSRSTKRAERKQRKEKELKEKLKEIENEEMKQLHEKFAKYNPDIANHIRIDELDPDFDVDECLKRIEEYHNNLENEDEINMEKPVFSDEDIYEDEFEETNHYNKRKNKKSKKKSKAKDDSKQFNGDPEKPGSFKSFYKHNKHTISVPADRAKGLKFNYANTEPLDFGLTPDEILYADDKELNMFASLKKIKMRSRGPELEERDRKKYSTAKMMEKKKQILKSVYTPDEPEEVESSQSIKKDKSRKRKYNLPEYGERLKSLNIKKGYYNHKLRKTE